MAGEAALFSTSDAARIGKAVRHVEGLRPKITVPSQHRDGFRYNLVVMLLDDLLSGSFAKAAILVADKVNQQQFITMNGEADDDTTFSITWNPDPNASTINKETVQGISIHATPAELRDALLEFSFIRSGEVTVDFGNHLRSVSRWIENPVNDPDEPFVESSAYDPLRFIVSFSGSLSSRQDLAIMEPRIQDGDGLGWMKAEKTFARDSGETIEVFSPLPTGQTVTGRTVLKRGNLAEVAWTDSWGYCVHALECRTVDYY